MGRAVFFLHQLLIYLHTKARLPGQLYKTVRKLKILPVIHVIQTLFPTL